MSGFQANTNRAEVILTGKKVTFISQTNDKFEVPVEYCACSSLVQESLSFNPDDPNPEVPLPNINTATLVKVIKFMEEFTKEPFPTLPRPLPKTGLTDVVRPYYREFLDTCEMVSDTIKNNAKQANGGEATAAAGGDGAVAAANNTSIVELLLAGTFLQIKGLKELAVAKMAQSLREKNFTDVKKMFKCEDLNWDYKKMDQLHKDHAWCFDAKPATANTAGAGGNGN